MHTRNYPLTSKLIFNINTILCVCVCVCVCEGERRGSGMKTKIINKTIRLDKTLGALDNEDDEMEVSSKDL